MEITSIVTPVHTNLLQKDLPELLLKTKMVNSVDGLKIKGQVKNQSKES